MKVNPYLMFNGRCDEAIEFYRSAVGAELKCLMRFKDPPDGSMTGPGEKVLHAGLGIGTTTVRASDGRCDGATTFQGFTPALTVASVTGADACFDRLADGGTVHTAMEQTF